MKTFLLPALLIIPAYASAFNIFSGKEDKTLVITQVQKVDGYIGDKTERIRAIKLAIEHYQELDKQGLFTELENTGLLEKGAKGEKVFKLANHLTVTGDLESNPCVKSESVLKKLIGGSSKKDKTDDKKTAIETCEYSGKVEEGVKNFQKRHGMKIDGIVGSNTYSVLNRSPKQAIKSLELNMNRMKDFDGFNDDEFILVNIPSFRLNYIADGEKLVDQKVIVGKPSWETPSFYDKLEKFVVNPAWYVPPSITAEEIAAKVAKDPNYLEKKNMEVRKNSYLDDETVDPNKIDWNSVTESDFDYFVVRKPGEKNPLGEIKYLFPNDNAIYIHDTAAKSLFKRDTRSLSHGCIRMENPFELAENLASRKDRKHARKMIDEAKKTGETVTVKLKNPVPVHLVYWTAWVDENGYVNFRDDIYGRDS